MPLFKKKYAPRRKMVARRRLARKNYISKSIRSKPNVYHFKRSIFLKDYSVVTTSDVSGAIQFALVDVPGVTDFTNLYDQYRFNKVVWKLIPKVTEMSLNAGTTNNGNCQQIHSALDYDDATAPPSVGALVQYQSHKMTRGNMIHTRVIVPKVQHMVSGSLSAAPKAKTWLDCDQTGIPHRGIKFIIPAATTAGTQLLYDLQMTYYLSFKGVV